MTTDDARPSQWGHLLLAGLNLKRSRTGAHMYEGTANPKAVAQRRARNRAARQSRRANRHR